MKTNNNTNRCSPRTTTAVRTQSTARKIDAHSIAPMVCQRLLMRVVFQNCQDVVRTLLCRFFQIIHRKARFLEGKELHSVCFGDTSTLKQQMQHYSLENEAFQEVCFLGERSRTSKLTNRRSAVLVLGGSNKRQLLPEPPALCKSLEPFAKSVTQAANRLPPCG
jgi:hypothetical protein